MMDYFGKLHSLVDSLATTGNSLLDKEMVTYLLISLDPSYEAFITSVTTRANLISSQELYQLLLIHESCTSHQQRTLPSFLDSSANLTMSTNRDTRS